MKTEIIRVYGIVQGVGFRPFVSREASDLGLCGTVANKGSYVEIHAQGSEKAVDELKKALENRPPERSVVMEIISAHLDEPPFDSFEIIDSEKEKGDIFVSPDIAVCEKCKAELFDKTNRRYLHPFTVLSAVQGSLLWTLCPMTEFAPQWLTFQCAKTARRSIPTLPQGVMTHSPFAVTNAVLRSIS